MTITGHSHWTEAQDAALRALAGTIHDKALAFEVSRHGLPRTAQAIRRRRHRLGLPGYDGPAPRKGYMRAEMPKGVDDTAFVRAVCAEGVRLGLVDRRQPEAAE